MFRVNEACDGKGTLTVKDGQMMIHVSLGSKNIRKLYLGSAKDAARSGAKLIEPTLDEVTYKDGYQEEVFGFDIPVPVLDQEFDLALIGKKGKWYDHKVKVTLVSEVKNISLENGDYSIELTFEGGSGKAQILSPAVLKVSENNVTAVVEWNSPNYDYMIVEGEKFLPTNTEGNSVFEIPVATFDEPFVVIGDTIAMSKPHEVEYTLIFHSKTIKDTK